MINLKSLIDLLPIYFKDRDTYKNEEEEGILERFLQVCGDYFNDVVTPDIDNTVNLIDIDATDEIYLNYIWELFGSIPYAYGILIDTRLWDTYSNISKNQEAWLKAIEALPPRANARDLLKFAIPLYKIRGTINFYSVLLKFYGYKCILSDPTGDFVNPYPEISYYDSIPYYDSGLLYDSNEVYDESKNCLSCVGISLSIYVSHEVDYMTPDFFSRLCSLLNRFRPLNVKPFDKSNILLYNRLPSELVYDYDDYITDYYLQSMLNI